MSEEFAYKSHAGQWISGFDSRSAAIAAATNTGITQVITAEVTPESPAYFARFEARTVLGRMISGLEFGEEAGKLVDGGAARQFLAPILAASLSDGLPDGPLSDKWALQVDLMNRLQTAVDAWIQENELVFPKPKMIVPGSEQLHIASTNLDIPFL